MSLPNLLSGEFGFQKFIKRFQYQLQLLCNCHMYPVVKERVTSLQDKPSMSYDWLNCHESLTKSWHHITVIENDFLILWWLTWESPTLHHLHDHEDEVWHRVRTLGFCKICWHFYYWYSFLSCLSSIDYSSRDELLSRALILRSKKRDEVFTFDRQLYLRLYLEHI